MGMPQRHKSPTVTARLPRDLVVAATRKAGELTAELGRHVTVGEVFAIGGPRGIASVTASDLSHAKEAA
jgi:hypothetical protein